METIKINKDAVAICHIAIYYGLPSQGHSKCLDFIDKQSRHTPYPVTLEEAEIREKKCIHCGKWLIKRA